MTRSPVLRFPGKDSGTLLKYNLLQRTEHSTDQSCVQPITNIRNTCNSGSLSTEVLVVENNSVGKTELEKHYNGRGSSCWPSCFFSISKDSEKVTYHVPRKELGSYAHHIRGFMIPGKQALFQFSIYLYLKREMP